VGAAVYSDEFKDGAGYFAKASEQITRLRPSKRVQRDSAVPGSSGAPQWIL
jgi:hypothetical protein